MRASPIIVCAVAAVPVAALGLASNAPLGPRPGFEDPQMYSTTLASPSEVRVEFKERVDPAGSGLTVRNSKGLPVSLAPSSVSPTDARLVTIGLKSLPSDTYTVQWHATGATSHRSSDGAYRFTVLD